MRVSLSGIPAIMNFVELMKEEIQTANSTQ